MKSPHILSMLLAASALALTSVNAQTSVTSDVVGYVTYSTADGVDSKLGIPMVKPVSSDAISSLTAGTLTVSSDSSALDTGNYIQFTSGSLDGLWFQVSTANSTSITVAENLETLGAVATDSFDVYEAWTLSSLFGTSFPVSTDVFSPVAQILTNDVTSTGINKAPTGNFAYHDGTSGFVDAGWYDVNDSFGGNKDNEPLLPDTFITIRNETGSQIDTVIAGSVPSEPIAFSINAGSVENDNLIYNPYPTDVQLSLSGLQGAIAVSTDVFSPTEQIIVYSSSPSGLNPSPTFNYAYHDGTSGIIGAGWFDVNDTFGGSSNTVTIPAGGAFLIRKAAGGSDSSWTASLPYSL